MIQTNKSVTENAYDYVFELLKNKLPGYYVYHNIKHTEDVAESVKKIAGKLNLNAEDTEIVILAALFHDTGFIERTNNHEDKSIEIAKNYLDSINYDKEKIKRIVSCIDATRYPQSPGNLLEEIIADSDLLHLGTKDYNAKTELLRLEWERSENKKFTDLEWLKINIDFLTAHKYFTKYAVKNLDESKTEKLIKLQKLYRDKLKEEENSRLKEKKLEIISEDISLKKEALHIEKTNSESADDLIVNSLNVLFNSGNLTDRKANTMIIVNSFLILLPVLLLSVFAEINKMFLIPVFFLLAVSMSCIIYAVTVILSVHAKYNLNDPGKMGESVNNSLFFNNFSRSGMNEFKLSLKNLLNNKEQLSDSLISDLYFLNKKIDKKNKYLGVCYTIFIYGLVLFLLVFAIVYFQILSAQGNLY